MPSPKKALSRRPFVGQPSYTKEPSTPPRTTMRRGIGTQLPSMRIERTFVPYSTNSTELPTTPVEVSTESGMTSSVRAAAPLKASSPIVLTPSGRTTRVSVLLLAKAEAPTSTVPARTV